MKKQTLHKIINYLEKNVPDLRAIYLFGSVITESFYQGSDIDIGLLSASKINKSKLFSMRSDLEVILDKDVDLVDLRDSSEVFQAQVIAYGNRIYTDDAYEMEVENFEDRVFQSYIYLKENIRPILEEIKSSGQIYHNHKNG